MASKAAILDICPELERSDIEALRSVATCWVILYNCVVGFCRSLPETTDVVASFDDDTAIVETEKTEEEDSNLTFERGTRAGETMDQ